MYSDILYDYHYCYYCCYYLCYHYHHCIIIVIIYCWYCYHYIIIITLQTCDIPEHPNHPIPITFQEPMASGSWETSVPQARQPSSPSNWTNMVMTWLLFIAFNESHVKSMVFESIYSILQYWSVEDGRCELTIEQKRFIGFTQISPMNVGMNDVLIWVQFMTATEFPRSVSEAPKHWSGPHTENHQWFELKLHDLCP